MLYSFFFFKQKTAYEMRISDWSSDVCSSDLGPEPVVVALERVEHAAQRVPFPSVGTWPPQGDLSPMLARRMRAAWNHDRMKSGAVSQPGFDRASSAAAKCASWSACALPNAGRAVTRAT